LLYGRPEIESRLGTPEEALYRAESNEDYRSGTLRVVYIKILYVCSNNVKIKIIILETVNGGGGGGVEVAHRETFD
jgi:hypothetical protein